MPSHEWDQGIQNVSFKSKSRDNKQLLDETECDMAFEMESELEQTLPS